MKFLETFPTELPKDIENVVLPRDTYLALVKAANENAETLHRADKVLGAAESGLDQANKRIQQLTQWLESAEATIAEKNKELDACKKSQAQLDKLAAERDGYCDAYLRQRSANFGMQERIKQLEQQKDPVNRVVHTQVCGPMPITAEGMRELDRIAQTRIAALRKEAEKLDKQGRARRDAVLDALEDLIDEYR